MENPCFDKECEALREEVNRAREEYRMARDLYHENRAEPNARRIYFETSNKLDTLRNKYKSLANIGDTDE